MTPFPAGGRAAAPSGFLSVLLILRRSPSDSCEIGKILLDSLVPLSYTIFRIILNCGVIMTKYEKAIFQIVDASRSHLTAEQIFQLLRETYPSVVLATVYNNLNKLWQAGRICKVSVEGMPDRYDRIARHDHLVCKGCGRLMDVDLTDLTQQLQDQVGIPILGYDLKLLYLCPDCQRKRRKRNGKEEPL